MDTNKLKRDTSWFRPSEKFGTHSTIFGIFEKARPISETRFLEDPNPDWSLGFKYERTSLTGHKYHPKTCLAWNPFNKAKTACNLQE